MKLVATALYAYHAQYGQYINPCYPTVSNQIDVCPASVGGGYGQGPLWLMVSSGAISNLSKGVQLTSPTQFIGDKLPIDPFMTAALTNPDIKESSAIYYVERLETMGLVIRRSRSQRTVPRPTISCWAQTLG